MNLLINGNVENLPTGKDGLILWSRDVECSGEPIRELLVVDKRDMRVMYLCWIHLDFGKIKDKCGNWIDCRDNYVYWSWFLAEKGYTNKRVQDARKKVEELYLQHSILN